MPFFRSAYDHCTPFRYKERTIDSINRTGIFLAGILCLFWRAPDDIHLEKSKSLPSNQSIKTATYLNSSYLYRTILQKVIVFFFLIARLFSFDCRIIFVGIHSHFNQNLICFIIMELLKLFFFLHYIKWETLNST